MNRITRCLLSALMGPLLLAQEGGGTLVVGTITDTSQGTGLSRTAQSDNLGNYLTERTFHQLRVEFFNIMNKANFQAAGDAAQQPELRTNPDGPTGLLDSARHESDLSKGTSQGQMINGFGNKLREGRGLLGAWCTFASFASAEVMTNLSFDFLILDMQHCELTQAQFPGILGAFHGGGPTPVVRTPKNDYHIINWLFDQGVGAVLVPMVNSVEDARRAVEAAKFPPLGRRSFGPYRAATYSFNAPRYMAEAGERSTLIIQIESEEAARNADQIMAVPGIDAVFVGPNDLAFSMLRPGQTLSKPSEGSGAGDGAKQWTAFARTPEVLALCDEIFLQAKVANMPFGMTSGSIEQARNWLDKGASLMTLGSDFLFIRAGAKLLCTMPESKPAGAGS